MYNFSDFLHYFIFKTMKTFFVPFLVFEVFINHFLNWNQCVCLSQVRFATKKLKYKFYIFKKNNSFCDLVFNTSFQFHSVWNFINKWMHSLSLVFDFNPRILTQKGPKMPLISVFHLARIQIKGVLLSLISEFNVVRKIRILFWLLKSEF